MVLYPLDWHLNAISAWNPKPLHIKSCNFMLRMTLCLIALNPEVVSRTFMPDTSRIAKLPIELNNRRCRGQLLSDLKRQKLAAYLEPTTTSAVLSFSNMIGISDIGCDKSASSWIKYLLPFLTACANPCLYAVPSQAFCGLTIISMLPSY